MTTTAKVIAMKPQAQTTQGIEFNASDDYWLNYMQRAYDITSKIYNEVRMKNKMSVAYKSVEK